MSARNLSITMLVLWNSIWTFTTSLLWSTKTHVGPFFLIEQYWGASRSTQERDEFGKPASHLLGRMLALLVFPRSQLSFDQVTCDHEMIVHDSHDVTPKIELLWCL